MIYWDHNATTPCLPEVVAAMQPYLSDAFANPSSSHMMGRHAAAAVRKARQQVADLVQCSPPELVFTSGATESNNLLFLSVLLTPRTLRRRVVISAIEHKSIMEPARLLAEHGLEIAFLPVSSDGVVTMDAAEEIITEDVLLVSVHAANNELGTLQPVAELAELSHKRGAYFHTDAAQVLGRVPFSLEAISCDFASFSAHKMYGPKGVGALFVRGGAKRWPWAYPFRGGGQEAGLRPGTSNVPAIVGFGEASDIAVAFLADDGPARLRNAEDALFCAFEKKIPQVTVHAQSAQRIPGVVAFAFDGIPADLVVDNLSRLALGRGAACSGGTQAPSHVLSAIGCNNALAKSSIRISFGRDMSISDIGKGVEELCQSFQLIGRLH